MDFAHGLLNMVGSCADKMDVRGDTSLMELRFGGRLVLAGVFY